MTLFSGNEEPMSINNISICRSCQNILQHYTCQNFKIDYKVDIKDLNPDVQQNFLTKIKEIARLGRGFKIYLSATFLKEII